MPSIDNNAPQNGKQREQTLRLVVKGLASKPAYLIIFGLGLVNTGIVGLTVLMDFQDVILLAFGAWFIYCVVALAVIYRIEVTPNHGEDISDQTAKDEFMRGYNAAFLAGEWISTWLPTGETDEAKAEQVELTVTTKECRVFICAYANLTGRTFWMWGRLSDNNALALLTWGKFRGGYGGMSGVDFLIIDRESTILTLKGSWVGHSKAGNIVSGTTVWKKVGSYDGVASESGRPA